VIETYNNKEMHKGHLLWKIRQGVKDEPIATLDDFF